MNGEAESHPERRRRRCRADTRPGRRLPSPTPARAAPFARCPGPARGAAHGPGVPLSLVTKATAWEFEIVIQVSLLSDPFFKNRMVKTTVTATAGPLNRFLVLRKTNRPPGPPETRTLSKLAAPTATCAGCCGSLLSAPSPARGPWAKLESPPPLVLSLFFSLSSETHSNWGAGIPHVRRWFVVWTRGSFKKPDTRSGCPRPTPSAAASHPSGFFTGRRRLPHVVWYFHSPLAAAEGVGEEETKSSFPPAPPPFSP